MFYYCLYSTNVFPAYVHYSSVENMVLNLLISVFLISLINSRKQCHTEVGFIVDETKAIAQALARFAKRNEEVYTHLARKIFTK